MKPIEGVTATGKKRKSRRGRPTSISQSMIENIVFSLKAGCYIETAAAYAGISKDTLFSWLRRGRREKKRVAKSGKAKVHASEAQFVIFLDGVTRAMSESEVRDVSIIAKAANGGGNITEEKIFYDSGGNMTSKQVTTKTIMPQWQAAAWRLERKHPKKWGRRVAISKDEGNGDENEDYLKFLRTGIAAMSAGLGCGIEEEEAKENEPDDSNNPVPIPDSNK